ncbi:hypothetical protein SDRG_07518 [Saprolegnia diclina VS20]|uniref:Uncharacterized protein n=1 Tax=Saprolegnia diclina (strain VS20) TaxID=1156394 RepID=T0RRY9_SAPDV|nr:hypothetical protein SDRG_07518 [Saprolegnia diclina VS20]EQC35293.1 hypothetical protein SDRG_07518 [Saprolegnia diclina VS20]|eukprot:XP_008611577.1 hypothetical protein SDRG_07518 [Saprolegnia diclina VS20]
MCDEIIMGCCAAIFCSSGSSKQASQTTTRPVDETPAVPIVVSPVPVVSTTSPLHPSVPDIAAASAKSPLNAAKDEGTSSSTTLHVHLVDGND